MKNKTFLNCWVWSRILTPSKSSFSFVEVVGEIEEDWETEEDFFWMKDSHVLTWFSNDFAKFANDFAWPFNVETILLWLLFSEN